MKLTLRTVEYNATRPTLNIRHQRKGNVSLRKVKKNFEVSVEGSTARELQKQLDDVTAACRKAGIFTNIVVTDEMLNGSREPIDGWERPDISGLREVQLIDLCDELAIEHDDRLGVLGLKAALNAYFTGQEAFYHTFQTEGKKPPMPPQSIKGMQVMAKAQDEHEAKQEAPEPNTNPVVLDPMVLSPEDLETYVNDFTDKDALIAAVETHTGTKLDKRRKIEALRKNALKALSVARIKAKGSEV